MLTNLRTSKECNKTLYYCNDDIKQVKSTKYLGIIIDSNLTWEDHIDYLYKKIIKFTSIFYKLRENLPTVVKKMLYFAFIHSQMAYGIEVYGNTFS